MPITLLGNAENEGSRQNKMKIVQRKKNLQKRIIFEWKDKTKKYKLFANKRLVVVKTKIHLKTFLHSLNVLRFLVVKRTNERCTKKNTIANLSHFGYCSSYNPQSLNSFLSSERMSDYFVK
jgi:hypothetical protein